MAWLGNRLWMQPDAAGSGGHKNYRWLSTDWIYHNRCQQ